MVRPDATPLGELMEWALAVAKGREAVRALVPDFQGHVIESLKGHGFGPEAEFLVCVKSAVVRVEEASFAPARV
jgi:hypothetical protein